ncbi:MAG: glycoside hydrolase family 97 protein [Rikenellaceae bacterium]
MKKILHSLFLAIFMIASSVVIANATEKKITLLSPDGAIEAKISVGQQISYTLSQDGIQLMAPSIVSMTLTDGTIWGGGLPLKSVKKVSGDFVIETPHYRSDKIEDKYNGVILDFNGWKLEFRAFDDAVAYRFISEKEGEYEIKNEQADFNFLNDATSTFSYVASEGSIEHQFFQSFENTYTTLPLSEIDRNRLIFMPFTVDAPQNRRITITESDLRDYPGMYIVSNPNKNTLSGLFAPVRDVIEEHAGYNNLQVIVKSRHGYIASVDGARSFPWRVMVVSDNDAQLANTEVVYKLASENVIGDTSWVKPGKVAWDWWNNWNLEGVGFKAGINNETYKYYIDFASEYGIEYVILDEGWSVNKVYDLLQVVPEIDIQELVDYGAERNVGIILWAGYYAFDRDMENVCKVYSQMGVKGFKIDFMNGDCQDLVLFNERSAQMTAKYKLMLDIHGTYKPTGLERTYPNIVNYEGVFGLEQMKWQPKSVDQVTYDVTMPFIRMIAGPIDYTQGAMRNAVRTYNSLADSIENQYYPSFTKPMSQGTRTRQLAQYVVFFSPLNMLCDTPTNYEANPVSTEYIASIPTVWDESRVVKGTMGEYIVTARRKGDRWYIGGINNWDVRDITLDIKAITGKSGVATLYKDGINADNNGEDFEKTEVTIGDEPFTVKMAGGGGFVVIL